MPIDPKAEALLAKNKAAMLNLRSYAAECWTTITFSPGHRFQNQRRYQYSTLLALKPNLMRYEFWELKKNPLTQKLERATVAPELLSISNGKEATQQSDGLYSTDNKVAPKYLHTLLEPWTGFFTDKGTLKISLEAYRTEGGTIHSLALLPTEEVESTLCEVVSYHYAIDTSASQENVGRLFLDKDGLVRRHINQVRFGGSPGFTTDAVLRKVRKNFAPPAQQAFLYTPPPGVKRKGEFKRAPLLANGKQAPDFMALDSMGKSVRLSDFRSKIVVLDFWATWCDPCMQAMPSTNKIARAFKDQAIVVLGVNVWDEKDACFEWIKKNQSTYESMVFIQDPAGTDTSKKNIAATLYNVTGIPTQFVIDRRGIVHASFVGFNEDETPLRNAIEAALKL